MSKSIQVTSMMFQCEDNVNCSNRFSFVIHTVCDHVPDHAFKKYFQYSSHLLVDVGRDMFDSSPSRQSTDCWMADVVEGII